MSEPSPSTDRWACCGCLAFAVVSDVALGVAVYFLGRWLGWW